LAALLLLFFAHCAAAQVVVDADGQLGLARDAFERGQYPQAAIEYERFVYFFPEDPRRGQALLAVGRSHMGANNLDAAVQAFERLIDSPHGKVLTAGSPGVTAYLLLSRCHEAQGKQAQAVVDLENLIVCTSDPDVEDQARYRIGWLYLESAAIDSARRQFGRIGSPNADRYRLADLNQAMDRFDELPTKSPTLAGALGLVPGLGYLYCERPRDALVAFGVNAGLALAAIEAFEQDMETLGVLVGLVGLGFYTGSIHGTVNAAHKYNSAQARGFLEQLKQRFKVDVALAVSPTTVAAIWRW
jgi:tetratricopeptide (TPR) repeat protein